jgi:hypothetical protein
MWPFKNKSPEIQIEQVETQLRSFMPGRFHVSYDPAFPSSNGKIFRRFQVCFEVGPGEDFAIRAQVHDLFERMLAVLVEMNLVCESNHVTLWARRHCPDSKMYNPDHPFMFIVADWSGSTIQAMRKQANFNSWATICLSYRNNFDKNDPLTKKYSEKDSSSTDVDA